MEPVRILQVISFMDLLAAGMIVPQIPPQARNIGANHIVIGVIGAIYSAFQLVSSPMTGSLSDLKGRQTVLLLTLCLSGIAYTLLGVTTSILLFLGLRAILGITKHTQLLTQALAPDYIKDKNELSAMYGRLSTLKQAGMAIGPLISGHIMEHFPYNGFTIIAFLVGAIFAANSGLVRRLPQLEVDKQKEKEKNKIALAPTLVNSVSTNFQESLDQFYKIDWSKYWEVFSFKLFLSLCAGIYTTNFVLFIKLKYGITPITIGYIFSLFSTVGSLTSYFIDYINKYYNADKDYTERNMHVFAITIVSLLGVMIAPDISIYVVFMIPLSISYTAGALFTNDVILAKTDEKQRGTVLGVANNIRALSGVISPLITGVISQFVGVLYVINISIILAAVGSYKAYVVRQQSLEIKKK